MGPFPSLKGSTISSGQVAGAGWGVDMSARGGCWGGWHGECSMPLLLPSPLPDGDPTLHTGSLLPRSYGDADLAGPPDQEKVVGPQP